MDSIRKNELQILVVNDFIIIFRSGIDGDDIKI